MASRSDLSTLRQLQKSFSASLKDFAASPSNFRRLQIVPSSSAHTASRPRTLYVLDSSFNPPSLAHLRIATTALTQDPGPAPKRLLLLLATQNADKPSKPAPFEDRLVMMTTFASDVLAELGRNAQDVPESDRVFVDVGITKKPYFHDKAAAISESGTYPDTTEQVHLTGFDTLIRLFDTKYYPPEHNFAPLEPFLSRHRIRVTYRPDDSWGGREEQDAYLARIADGSREHEGAKKEWVNRVTMVEGKREGEEVVSSTKARKAVRQDRSTLETFVSAPIREWMEAEDLYKERL